MFEFLNTVAKDYPEVAIGLALIFSFGYLVYYILKTNKEERFHLQTTISGQHKEAIDMSGRIMDSNDKHIEVLTELKTIIQTLNK